MSDAVAPTLTGLVERFNQHTSKRPKVAEELGGLERTIAVRLSDGASYAVDLKNGQLENLRSPAPAKADVAVVTDTATFLGLVRKEIGPMKALVTGRLKLEGTLEDKLLFRRLI